MRPLALLLLVLVLLAGFLFVLNSGGDSGGEGALPLTPGLAPEPEADPLGPAQPLPSADTEFDPGPASGRAAVLRDEPLSARASEGPGAIDVMVLDQSGGALLGSAGSLPLTDQAWVRLFLGSGSVPVARDPLQGLKVVSLPEPRRRTSQRKGWVTALEPPGGDAYIALALGDSIVCAVPVPPDASEVEIVADVGDFDSMYASLEGSLAGMVEASRLVRIRPERPRSTGAAGPRLKFGRVPLSIAVDAVGGRFTAKRLPPGSMTVVVRAEATALGPALHAAKESQGLSALSMGARVPSADQWELRLGVVRRLQLPVADLPITLAPGEHRQLGLLSTERSAAVVLDLTDAKGQPVEATSVDVMLLAAPGEPEESVLTWTFETSASLYPLVPRLTEFMVVQGDLGALIEVQPEPLEPQVPIATRTVRLERLSVVRLPDRGAGSGASEPQLLTGPGRRVRIDPRWLGSRYCGHEIRGRTLAVPAGSYRIEQAGVRTTIKVGPGEFIDASSGTPSPATKLKEDGQ